MEKISLPGLSERCRGDIRVNNGGRAVFSVGKIVVAAGLLLFSTVLFVGNARLEQYEKIREDSRSVQSGFVEMERALIRGARFLNLECREELMGLYLEMALVENEFGSPVKREEYLDKAIEAGRELIRRNPADAMSYYRMGIAFTLSNYPLCTYFDRAKDFFRMALDRDPLGRSCNLNIYFIYLSQRDFLNKEDLLFLQKQYERIRESIPDFQSQLKALWKEQGQNEEKLEMILRELIPPETLY